MKNLRITDFGIEKIQGIFEHEAKDPFRFCGTFSETIQNACQDDQGVNYHLYIYGRYENYDVGKYGSREKVTGLMLYDLVCQDDSLLVEGRFSAESMQAILNVFKKADPTADFFGMRDLRFWKQWPIDELSRLENGLKTDSTHIKFHDRAGIYLLN